MPKLDLSQDAEKFHAALEKAVAKFVKSKKQLSAIEVGFDCCQGGWIWIHGDQRQPHERDGEWTAAKPDVDLKMPHWIKAVDAALDGKEVAVINHLGKEIDLTEESDSELVEAIGEMLRSVVAAAKKDGLFEPLKLSPKAKLQIDLEDFNGSWAWPEYDDLGKKNLL